MYKDDPYWQASLTTAAVLKRSALNVKTGEGCETVVSVYGKERIQGEVETGELDIRCSAKNKKNKRLQRGLRW